MRREFGLTGSGLGNPAIERKLARLPLSFTTGSVPSGVYYAGNGGLGTRFAPSGLLVPSIPNQPRLDYNPDTLAELGILIEPAATNILGDSNNFLGGWTVGELTPVQDVTGIDGATSAWTLTNTAVNALHRAYQFIGSTEGSRSIYAKAGTADFIGLSFDGTNGAVFNLAAGTIAANIGSGTSSITAVDGGWYRLDVNGTGVWYMIFVGETQAQATPGTSYAGTSKSVIVQFGQAETGAGTSYVPVGTRTADVLRFTIPVGVSTLRYTFDDDTTQDVAATGAYTVPTNLTRSRIKTIASA